MENQPVPEMLSLKQVARRLSVTSEMVRQEILRGKMRAIRVGTRYRVLESDLNAYIDRSAV